MAWRTSFCKTCGRVAVRAQKKSDLSFCRGKTRVNVKKNVNTTCSMLQQSAYFQTFKQLHGNKHNWAILISIRQVNSFIGILSVLEDGKKINDNCGICAKGCAVNENQKLYSNKMMPVPGMYVDNFRNCFSSVHSAKRFRHSNKMFASNTTRDNRRMWIVCALRKRDGRSSCSVDLDHLCLSQFQSQSLWLLWLCETCGIWKLCEVSREHNMKNPAQHTRRDEAGDRGEERFQSLQRWKERFLPCKLTEVFDEHINLHPCHPSREQHCDLYNHVT